MPVEVVVDPVVADAAAGWLEAALPGIVAAAMTANTPTAVKAQTPIHVVTVFSRSRPMLRARMRACTESIPVYNALTPSSERP